MGFNFGAMLGGAATQIVDDINEKEKDIKLRTRTILDRQSAMTAANQKEFKAQEKKVTEQINSLVGIFGNTPEGIAKARDIVAGGDTHYTNMYSQIQEHTKNDGDANDLIELTKGANDIGFKGVEDAVGSIVKLAALPEIKLGTGFGANYFKKEQQAMIDAGLIQTMQLNESAKRSYGSTKIHLNKMAKKAKTMDEILNETRAKRDKALKSGTQEEIKVAEANYQRSIQDQKDESITYQSALKAAEAKSSGKSTYREISSNFAADIKRFENDLYVGGDKTKIRADNEDGFLGIRDGGDKIKQQKLKQYGTNWLKGQIDGNGDFINSEAEQFVKDNGTLSSLLPGVIASVTGEKDTSGDSSSEPDGTQSKEQKNKKLNETITNIAANSPIGGDSVYQIIQATGSKVRDPIKLEENIKKSYPNATEIEIAKAVQVALKRLKKEDVENKGIDDAYKRNIDAIRNPNKVSAPVAKGNPKYDQQENVIKEREKLKKLEERDKRGIFG